MFAIAPLGAADAVSRLSGSSHRDNITRAGVAGVNCALNTILILDDIFSGRLPEPLCMYQCGRWAA
jgi:hypothetical protein